MASVLLSTPGPIILGVALFFGRSSTQLADFIRRSAELIAIIVSWLVYRILQKNDTRKAINRGKLEQIANTSVGAAMSLSGVAMIFIAVFSSSVEKGNVIPGLVIAILGAITNCWFWLRYMKLNQIKPNPIFSIQSKLYGAKTLVDICVTTALALIVLAPGTPTAQFVDLGGSIVVALYLIFNGIVTIRASKSVVSEHR